jgi:2-polyprenyl-3-methyl-5-hydroxy-6-metoxy-1,4-benzoquinol methylase
MNDTELRQVLDRYAFYHIIKLTDTISTPGYPEYVPAQNLCMKYLKSLDLKGKRVLDIGCRDGLFSFAAESMGAAEVVGIDNDLSKAATEFLIPFFNSKVRMYQMNLYDLKPESFGRFDVIIFPGVLYHLRYPFWGLRAIRDVLNSGGHLLIETGIWLGERNNAMLFCPIGGDSPYAPDETSCTFFNEKGLVDTLTSLGFQTVHTELLSKTASNATLRTRWLHRALHPRTALRNFMKRLTTFMSIRFHYADRPPNKQVHWCVVNRCVVHSIFSAFDKDTFIASYWEATHDFHTSDGDATR